MSNSAVAEPQRTASIEFGTSHFQEANKKVREALETADRLEISNVFAQRYLGCALEEGKHLSIHGTPGNDMACYMDGGSIEVFGNAQDQIGNTMNGGKVVVHGRCGDAAGYAMRGGKILVRDDCGWRVGIHMKQYQDRFPIIVIGGDAGSFLGEYMAGGMILLMGSPGEYTATGMHGGVIYLRNKLDDGDVMTGLVQEPVDEDDAAMIASLLEEYNECFADDLGSPVDCDPREFYRLKPASSRPYASMYV